MERKKLYLVTLASAAVVAGSLVAVGVLQSGGSSPKPAAVTTMPGTPVTGVAEARSLFAGIPQSGPVLGSPKAPVTLVEYADPQCPYCRQWALEALPAIVKEYVRPGRVRLEFRPIAFVGPESEAGVTALLALGERGRLWQATHLLYANQGPENSGWINDNLIGAVASKLGVGWPAFETYRYSRAISQAMERARRAAVSDGITGTPSFFAGPTGGVLQPVPISSLDASALRPVLDRLLGA